MLASIALCGAPASAIADELDSFCGTATGPRSIALCSDPELRVSAIKRQHAFDQAVTGLSPDARKALLADQKGWVESYALACGLSQVEPPPLPLPAPIKDCMVRAGRARIAYLRAYAAPAVAVGNPAPSDHDPIVYRSGVSPSSSPKQFAPPAPAATTIAPAAAPTAATAPVTDSDLAASIAAKFRRPGYEVEVIAAEPKIFTLRIVYGSAMHPLVAQMDTRRVVRGALKELTAAGRSPATDLITVVVSAAQERRGETGAASVPDWICRTVYSPLGDRLDTEPAIDTDRVARVLYLAQSGMPEADLAIGAANQIGLDTHLAPAEFLDRLADKMRSQKFQVQQSIAEAFGIYETPGAR
jgi:uncharacterized protein YecT (DUF1311 family)